MFAIPLISCLIFDILCSIPIAVGFLLVFMGANVPHPEIIFEIPIFLLESCNNVVVLFLLLVVYSRNSVISKALSGKMVETQTKTVKEEESNQSNELNS